MQRLSAVREAKRIFFYTIVARVLLVLAPVLLIRAPLAFGLAGRALVLTPLVLMGVLSMVPWPTERLEKGSLAVLLTADMLMMNLRALGLMFIVEGPGRAWFRPLEHAALSDPFLLMLIPLVLLAWAYGSRGAVWGSLWGLLIHAGGAAILWAMGYSHQERVLLLLPIIGRSLLILGVALMIAELAKRQRQQMTELEAAHRSLQRHAATVERLAISRERNRMARDLHDTLSHSLAGLAIQLEALRTTQKHSPEEAEEIAEEALTLARRGLAESREAIQALRNDPVGSMGLIGATQDEVRSFEARSGVSASLRVLGEAIDLSPDEEMALYRNLQEALRNVERHAQATQVDVELAFGDDAVELEVEDDGVGFDPQEQEGDTYGLLGMRERAAMVGGALTVDSDPAWGTRIRFRLPR